VASCPPPIASVCSLIGKSRIRIVQTNPAPQSIGSDPKNTTRLIAVVVELGCQPDEPGA
jgi:hypothetical protein